MWMNVCVCECVCVCVCMYVCVYGCVGLYVCASLKGGDGAGAVRVCVCVYMCNCFYIWICEYMYLQWLCVVCIGKKLERERNSVYVCTYVLCA